LERTRDPIAFPVFLFEVFMQFSMTMC
jgi:hypothetical protein